MTEPPELLRNLAESLVVGRLTRERDTARAEAERLRRVNGEWNQVMGVLVDGLAERGITGELGERYSITALREIDRVAGERDEARAEVAYIKQCLGADGFDDGMGQVRRAEAAEEERAIARRERDEARAEVERRGKALLDLRDEHHRAVDEVGRLRAGIRDAYEAARAEPATSGTCRCGRPALVSERSGRIAALGSLLALLVPATTEETTHG